MRCPSSTQRAVSSFVVTVRHRRASLDVHGGSGDVFAPIAVDRANESNGPSVRDAGPKGLYRRRAGSGTQGWQGGADMSRINFTRRAPLRSWARVAVVMVAVLFPALWLPACGGSGSSGPLPQFQVQLGPGYTIHPSELQLPAARFELVVTNVDPQLNHSLVLLQRSTMTLAPGQSQRLIVKSGQEPRVGDYQMFCDVPNHRQNGQVGIVHVVDRVSITTG
jgi:hypothetical protein